MGGDKPSKQDRRRRRRPVRAVSGMVMSDDCTLSPSGSEDLPGRRAGRQRVDRPHRGDDGATSRTGPGSSRSCSASSSRRCSSGSRTEASNFLHRAEARLLADDGPGVHLPWPLLDRRVLQQGAYRLLQGRRRGRPVENQGDADVPPRRERRAGCSASSAGGVPCARRSNASHPVQGRRSAGRRTSRAGRDVAAQRRAVRARVGTSCTSTASRSINTCWFELGEGGGARDDVGTRRPESMTGGTRLRALNGQGPHALEDVGGPGERVALERRARGDEMGGAALHDAARRDEDGGVYVILRLE